MIYRLGSLGDTIVALPCFHLLAEVFQNAERRVLTNFPVDRKAPPLAAVLAGSGLVHDFIEYPVSSRNPGTLLRLRREIAAWRPEVLVYLNARRELLSVVRDALYFKFCGVRKLVGVPYALDLRENRVLNENGIRESESSRLARRLAELGRIDLSNPRFWDLRLSPAEAERADQLLGDWAGKTRCLAASVGTKVHLKDWGRDNWQKALGLISNRFPQLGLLMVGAAEEYASSEQASDTWRGPKLNLCGKLTPRETAAAMRTAIGFIGHDSGPLHIAAAMRLRCVGVYSARDYPGVWFPHGDHHEVIYHQTECFGCRLEVCARHARKCITSITPDEVVASAFRILKASSPQPELVKASPVRPDEGTSGSLS